MWPFNCCVWTIHEQFMIVHDRITEWSAPTNAATLNYLPQIYKQILTTIIHNVMLYRNIIISFIGNTSKIVGLAQNGHNWLFVNFSVQKKKKIQIFINNKQIFCKNLGIIHLFKVHIIYFYWHDCNQRYLPNIKIQLFCA